MVQSTFKSSKVPTLQKKSIASTKKREERKGAVIRQTKGAKISRNSVSASRNHTKAINAKNEIEVSCKAITSGSKFYLSDITKKGVDEMDKLKVGKEKHESKSSKLESRLKVKLAGMGREM